MIGGVDGRNLSYLIFMRFGFFRVPSWGIYLIVDTVATYLALMLQL